MRILDLIELVTPPFRFGTAVRHSGMVVKHSVP